MKESIVNKYIQTRLDRKNNNVTSTDIRINCADGSFFMVGVGNTRYSTPNIANADFYYALEIREHNLSLNDQIMLSVYSISKVIKDNRSLAHVPFYVIDDLIESHGGIRKEPAKFHHWNLIDPEYQYLVKNKNGEWYFYSHKPKKFTYAWALLVVSARDGKATISPLSQELMPIVEWEESLIERP